MDKAIDIIKNKTAEKEGLIHLLRTGNPDERSAIFAAARRAMLDNAGCSVSLRGLIELSNICSKNCYYCGIRSGNRTVNRYLLDSQSVMEAAVYAWRQGFGSIVIQSGERSDRAFTSHITGLLEQIGKSCRHELGITLSCGEQQEAVYREWLEAGAQRYLLRMETSDPALYQKLHPNTTSHSFSKRMDALRTLQRLGYQTGTGVMVGLPFQGVEQLAGDLLFMKEINIDMVGMGPYIPHPDTPLFRYRDEIPDAASRLELSLRMIALLRIMMPDINIAASTAMQALDERGRIRAIEAGANVFMPNLTPASEASNYILYEGKPVAGDMAADILAGFERETAALGLKVNYGQQGNSKHYHRRMAAIKNQAL
jgi:biotin synthase